MKTALELTTNSQDYSEFEKLSDTSEIPLSRELSAPGMPYRVQHSNFSEKTKKKILQFIQKWFPYILYFDDFTDRVPDLISFKDDYKSSGKLAFSKNKEWQEIIVEIFRRAEVEGIDEGDNPLQAFFQLNNEDRKDDILSDIEGILNREIIDEWKRIKSSGHKNFADDSENLSLQLKCEEQTFAFKVKDRSNQDKKRTFNISERSKGFQWFFNYMIKLKFNPRYQGKQENSIFLLDEPGSYLHSSAQSELLEELKNVSKKNTIVYCTHSQYLLNPKTIKLGSIKIIEKEKAKIDITDYGNYKGKDDKGALSAVYQALRLNFMQEFVGKIVITEGTTDLFFFEMLRKHTRLFQKDFKIVPGAGAGNQSNFISIGLSFSEGFVVLFDNDRGTTAIKKYQNEFGEEITRYFHLYGTNKNFRLESFFSKDEQRKIREITSTTNLKKALAILYYDSDSLQQESIFKNLSLETLQKLQPTIDRIEKL